MQDVREIAIPAFIKLEKSSLRRGPGILYRLGNQYTFERYFACYTEKGQTPRFQAQEQVYARNKVNQQNYDINVISHHVGS
jgi:hypothetical protein